MSKRKTTQERERELLEERAKLIIDHIRSTPDILDDVKEAIEAEKRGEGVPAREYLKSRGRSSV